MVDAFPNLFMISGPQSPFANIPVVIDNCVKWIGAVIDHARRQGVASVEATSAAADAWCERIQMLFDATVLSTDEKTINWYCGTNIPGKKRSVGFYFGGAGAYFQELQDSIQQGFPGFAFSGKLAAHAPPGASAGSAPRTARVS
jgi:cyclohexanone monooxygenase